jgi:hypothetical protein
VHSYYHLVPLVCYYCCVGYLSDSVDYIAPRSLSALPTLVCFLIFHQPMGKHLALLADLVSGLNPSVKLHDLHESVVPAGVTVLFGHCNPPCQGRGKLAKPGLLYPLVWIAFYDTICEKLGSRSRVGSIASDLESWIMCYDRQD